MASHLSPEQRSARAKAAAYARWSRHDPVPVALRGQDGLRARIARDLEAQGHLPNDLSQTERDRRITAGLRSHMISLSIKASKTRTAKAASARAAAGTKEVSDPPLT